MSGNKYCDRKSSYIRPIPKRLLLSTEMRITQKIFLLYFILLWPELVFSFTLTWDPNSESDLGGYNVHQGTSPGIYGIPIDNGNNNSYSISGIQEGVTYYFAVTAYDTSGNESSPSNEMGRIFNGQVENPEITSPTPETVLPGETVTFNWTTVPELISFHLQVGTAQGESNIYNLNQGTNQSVTVNGIPTDGKPLYARLYRSQFRGT